MVLKGIIDEDFVNYKKPAMVLEFPHCNFKCGVGICQNSPLAEAPDINIDAEKVCQRYINNPITEAIVFQGLEPFDSWDDMQEFIIILRYHYKCMDDIVIYTGYDDEEIVDKLAWLECINNVIVKFGRYIPDQASHYDYNLGVNLASDNQYARRISP